jgi:hypothetical protein
MRRLFSAAALVLLVTTALAQGAGAATEFAKWRVAEFANAPGRGSATSVLSVCATVDGVEGNAAGVQCGKDQVGPGDEILSPRVTTVFRGRTPGENWQLEVFDRGTCNLVRHLVVSLPSITIGSTGRGTSRLLFSAAQYGVVAAAFEGPLTLRASHAGRHYCSPFGAARGGQ